MNRMHVTRSVEEIELRLFLEALYERYQHDFRGYSISSLLRRLAQAQTYFQCRSLSMLQDRVLREPEIVSELLDYLTIQVSEMFRDPSYFSALRTEVIPVLRTYPSLKVWIAGCSEGEELYSMAILFREEGLLEKTIFYATDINPSAIQKAEAGIYPLDRLPLFTQNHRNSGGKSSLSAYYTAAYNAAVFDKSLLSQVVFSEHNLASDSVFSEMHLVSCRNVLIYFGPDLQNRAFGLFKDSLTHGGFLGLGSKENIRFSQHSNFFADYVTSERIYRRIDPSVPVRGM